MKTAVCWLSLLAAGAPAAAACEQTGGDDARFARPAAGEIILQFGQKRHPLLNMDKFHPGVDFRAERGGEVRAAAAGPVVTARHAGEYGKLVAIDHGNGVETWYAHLSRIGVKEGDCVTTGTVLGEAGSTGLAPSIHLHFEVRFNGQPVDPLPLIDIDK